MSTSFIPADLLKKADQWLSNGTYIVHKQSVLFTDLEKMAVRLGDKGLTFETHLFSTNFFTVLKGALSCY